MSNKLQNLNKSAMTYLQTEDYFYSVKHRDATIKCNDGKSYIAKPNVKYNGRKIKKDDILMIFDGASLTIARVAYIGNEKHQLESVADALTARDVKSLKALEEAEWALPSSEELGRVHLNDTDGYDWDAYLYKGAWSVGSGAARAQVVLLEEYDEAKYAADCAEQKRLDDIYNLDQDVKRYTRRVENLEAELAEAKMLLQQAKAMKAALSMK